MSKRPFVRCSTLTLGLGIAVALSAENGRELRSHQRFNVTDVFELEYASDPQLSPDGNTVVYVRNSMDPMRDRTRSNLWNVDADGSRHRPLTSGDARTLSPRYSPDGRRLAYVSDADASPQLWIRWMDSGQTARITSLPHRPSGITWSPDGKWLAFSMFVPQRPEPFVKAPEKPPGAEWAAPPKVIEKLLYRSDGAGYLEDGNDHLFLLPSDGGTPRQLTFGPFNHTDPPAFTPDGNALVFAANRREDWELDPLNSELFELDLTGGEPRQLSDRKGPHNAPAVSPDGRFIAYVGFDDRLQGYQVRELYLVRRNGKDRRRLTSALDRDVSAPVWSADGEGLFFQYDDRGETRIGYVSTDGELEVLASQVGGTSLGRPYAGGSFSTAANGRFAFTASLPNRPADVAIGRRGAEGTSRITTLNEDLLGHKELGEVEEIWYDSAHDGRRIQGWIVKPPGFEAGHKYPLILEIHGGPFANYGPRFSAEIQLYAAAGYVVLYTNPRGSTSYGGEFGNLIHHDYPGDDYHDLMSGVDAVLGRGYVDSQRLFVTGGSGGGVLTSWIVGKTDRFRAAVAAKPVINWYSFALTADNYAFFTKYWFPAPPWEQPEEYLRRSPLSLVGQVATPTMVLTGERDFRTPISESEQYYQALKLRKVPTALVRIPEASHGIASRPSQLIAKVSHILKWFERHGGG